MAVIALIALMALTVLMALIALHIMTMVRDFCCPFPCYQFVYESR